MKGRRRFLLRKIIRLVVRLVARDPSQTSRSRLPSTTALVTTSDISNYQPSNHPEPEGLSSPIISVISIVQPLVEMSSAGDPERENALNSFKTKLLESREWEAKLKALRLDIKGLQKDFDHTEDNIKALQSVGQIIGEVLKQLDEERCRTAPKTW